MENRNSKEYLDRCMAHIFDSLRHMPFAPSVQMNTPAPTLKFEEDGKENPDVRRTQNFLDSKITVDEELSDSDDEDNRRNIHDAMEVDS